MRQVYLDHYSATPLLPEAFEAMKPFFSEAFANAGSLHQHGLRARDALDEARAQAADFINAASPEEIIFTSDGTEAANLAVKGAAYVGQRRGNHIIVSQIEHPSVLNSVEFLEKQGFTSTRVAVNRDGVIDPEAVRAAMTEQTILIAIQLVNHDIGTMEPVAAIGAIAAERGVPFYVDADAGAGWIPIDVQALGASFLSFSPHRFYGPKGVGVLYRNRRARLTGVVHGGIQESGRRAGVENVPAIAGAGVAMQVADRELPQRAAHTARLQRQLWEGILARVPKIRLNGPNLGPGRLSTNLNFSAEHIEGEAQLLRCDVNGIALATGSGCASRSLKVSHVLSAIGLPTALAQCNVIMTLGKDNTGEEIDYVIDTYASVVSRLREMSPEWSH